MREPDALSFRGTPPPEAELSARESLDLIRNQREQAARGLCIDPAPMVLAWGVAWLVGFGACYAASLRAGHQLLPAWAAWLVLGALSVAAAASVTTQLARHGRGVRGPSRSVAATYTLSWPVAFAGLIALDIGLTQQGLPAALAPLLWPASSMVVTGVMYLAGGIIFTSRVYYGLGAWMLAVGAASVFAGTPANFAVLALAGGGGMLAAAAILRAGGRRSPRVHEH